MSNVWYYIKGRDEFGPVSAKELKRLAREGELGPEDLVWKEGMEDWLPASALKNLISEETPGPPPGRRNRVESRQPVITLEPMPDSEEPAEPGRTSRRPADGVLERAVSRIRLTFAASLAATLQQGMRSFQDLISHPLRYTFAFLVLAVCCALSVAGLFTTILVPVFILGYISYMKSMIEGGQPTFSEFLSFLRNGWDSLWHLVMLLAAFIVTLALMLAPAILVGLVSYFLISTTTAGMLQISSIGKSEPARPEDMTADDREEPRWNQRNQAAQPRLARRAFDDAPEVEEGSWFSDTLGKLLSEAGAAVLGMLLILLLVLMGILVFSPVSAAMILIYVMALDVVGQQPSGENRFDLVYRAFTRMLTVLVASWKRLVTGGLYLATVLAGGSGVLYGLAGLLSNLGLGYLSLWLFSVLMPVGVFAFGIYFGIFCMRTSLELREAPEQAG